MTSRSADSSCGGKLLPLLSARRMIPAQAFLLKQYLCGTSRVSKTSDKEHTAASLGHSEELRVQNSPRQTVPEVIQRGQEAPEVVSLGSVPCAARERSRDVLPEQPARTELLYRSNVLPHEAGFPVQPPLFPAMEKDWQGLPPTTRSTAPYLSTKSLQSTFVTSPRLGTSGNLSASTAHGNGSISAKATGSQSMYVHATDAASMPLKRLT